MKKITKIATQIGMWLVGQGHSKDEAQFTTTFLSRDGQSHVHRHTNARDTMAWAQIIARSMQRAVRVRSGTKLIMFVYPTS